MHVLVTEEPASSSLPAMGRTRIDTTDDQVWQHFKNLSIQWECEGKYVLSTLHPYADKMTDPWYFIAQQPPIFVLNQLSVIGYRVVAVSANQQPNKDNKTTFTWTMAKDPVQM